MVNRFKLRRAESADIEVVLRFAAAAADVPVPRRLLGRPSTGRPIPAHRTRYEALLRDRDRHVLLVEDDDGDAVGMAILAADRTGPLLDLPVARLSHLVVERQRRNQGVGRLLIGAAAAFAERIGAEHVAAGVDQGSREGNRFFARLGFVPLSVHRVASLHMLRRNAAVPDVSIDVPLGSATSNSDVPGLDQPAQIRRRHRRAVRRTGVA